MFQNTLSFARLFGSIIPMEIGTDSAPQFLMDEFARRVRTNARYSLRAYARSLGMSPGALSEVLRGVRPLSHKAAARVIRSLGLNKGEANRLYSFIESEKRGAAVADDVKRARLDEDTFHLIAEWHHFAILNLMNTEGFRWQAAFIARRLGLTISQADQAMRLLMRLGLVIKRGEKVVPAHDYVLSPEGIPSAAIRTYHSKILELAAQALETQNLAERDITGVGFALDPAHLERIKKEIADFQDALTAKYGSGKKTEVYFLEMALFKMSKGETYD